MKKRTFVVGLSFSLLFLSMMSLAGCSNKETVVEHNFSTTWSSDESYHWHACTDDGCNEIKDKAAHTWNAGAVTKSATYDADGVKTFTCTVCGKTKTEAIPKLVHNYSTEWSKDATKHWHACTDSGYETLKKDEADHTWNAGEVTTAATFEATGVKTFACTVCGQTKTEAIPKLTHNYSTEWSKDTTKHWHACTDSGYETLKKDEVDHTWNAGEITTAATFEATGVKTFACTVCGQTKTETIPKLAHNYSTEWSHNATKHWHVCTDSGYETLKSDEASHTWGDPVKIPATDTTKGDIQKTCTVCGEILHNYSNMLLSFRYTKDYNVKNLQDKVYDGKEIPLPTAEDIITNSDGVLNDCNFYKYTDTKFTTPVHAIDAGIYILRTEYLAGENVRSGYSVDRVEITKKPLNYSTSIVYDGLSLHKLSGAILKETNGVVAPDVVSASFDVNSSAIGVVPKTGISNIKLLGTDKDNYSLSVDNLNFEITKVPAGNFAEDWWKTSYSPDKVYDGKAVESPTLDDFTVEQVSDNSFLEGHYTIEWTDSSNVVLASAPVNAGTYKVTVKVEETDYNEAASFSKTVTISKKTLGTSDYLDNSRKKFYLHAPKSLNNVANYSIPTYVTQKIYKTIYSYNSIDKTYTYYMTDDPNHASETLATLTDGYGVYKVDYRIEDNDNVAGIILTNSFTVIPTSYFNLYPTGTFSWTAGRNYFYKFDLTATISTKKITTNAEKVKVIESSGTVIPLDENNQFKISAYATYYFEIYNTNKVDSPVFTISDVA